MSPYKGKLSDKVSARQQRKAQQQDIFSATKFKEGLDKGKLEVGSILFSGDLKEEKIIKKICTYLGLNYLGKESITCGWLDCDNKFEVIHYKVEG